MTDSSLFEGWRFLIKAILVNTSVLQDVSLSFKDMKLRAEFSSTFLCFFLMFFAHLFRGKPATLHCGLTLFVLDGRGPQQEGGVKPN